MKKGFVKLHRELQDHWLWLKEPFDKRSAWIDLLFLANFKDARVLMDGQMMEVKRGQRITSIRFLCQRWGWSNTKVIAFLKTLEQDGMISFSSDKKKTVITIENYSKYQGESDTETTSNRHYNDTEQTLQHTNKNEKKEKNEKKVKEEPLPALVERWTATQDYPDAQEMVIRVAEAAPEPKARVPLPGVPYQQVKHLYHELCPTYPRIRAVTDQRKTAIAARWKEHGSNLDVFRELFQRAEASPFLKGDNFRKWRANFDWLMKANNMAKVLEGRYEHGSTDSKNSQTTIPEHFFA